MDELALTQQEVAQRLSKSRPYIANMLRLLQLPKDITQMVKDNKLSGAHGRTLLAIKDKQKMKSIAKQAYRESWSVRTLEQYVNKNTEDKKSIKDKKLTEEHRSTILKIKDKQKMKSIAKQAYRESWSVRTLEQYVNENTEDKKSIKDKPHTTKKPKFIQQQERQLKEQYGSAVTISNKNKKGYITFEFKSETEFRRLIHQLNEKDN